MIPPKLLSCLLVAAACLAVAGGANAGYGPAWKGGLAPTVSIDRPSPNAALRGKIRAVVTATGTVPVTTVEVKVDGEAYVAARQRTGSNKWTLQIDTTRFANGTHRLSARATDALGSQASSSVTVTFANESDRGSIYWGAFLDGKDTYNYYYGGNWGPAPWDGDTWHRFESNAGKRMSLVHWGMGTLWQHDFEFFRPALDLVQNAGDVNVVDLSTGTVPLREIAAGKHDAVLKRWAEQAARWGHPFMLALDVEMNGYWEPYGTTPPARNSPADFVGAWRRFHDIARRAHASNITWAWVPNIDIYHKFAPYRQLYPGDSYVDWTGLDGFNWGGQEWMTFSQIFSTNYRDLLQLAHRKPIVISQTGSAEAGGNKAAWITDMLSVQLPRSFPRVKALLWFNWRIYQKGTWQAWPIESSGTAQAAFADGLNSSYYVAGGDLADLPLRTKVPVP